MFSRLWLDEGGVILSAELILLLVITVIGISVGLVVMRDCVNSELVTVGDAITCVDAGFWFTGTEYDADFAGMDAVPGQVAGTQGSAYEDTILCFDPTDVLSAVEDNKNNADMGPYWGY